MNLRPDGEILRVGMNIAWRFEYHLWIFGITGIILTICINGIKYKYFVA